MCSEPVRSRERIVSNDKTGTHLTHIEDLKNPIQLHPPTGNLSLPVACSKVFNKFILPGQFVHLPLYFLNTPVIKSTVGGRPRNIRRRTDSRLQPIYRIAYRLAELVRPLSIRSPSKRITDIGTEYSEVHTILLVGHLVLTTFELGGSRSQRGVKHTLIVVRRIAATPKTAGAGVMLDASFPMFNRSMATSSEKIAPSRFDGCLDLSVMVEVKGRRKVAVLGKSRTEDPGR